MSGRAKLEENHQSNMVGFLKNVGLVCAIGALALLPQTTWAKPAKERDSKVRDYGRIRGEFNELCALLKEDGRSTLVATLLEPKLDKDPTCEDCRPLFSQFFAPCKPPPPPKVKGAASRSISSSSSESAASQPSSSEASSNQSSESPPPIAHPKGTEGSLSGEQAQKNPQRFPTLAVLDRASALSLALAADELNPVLTRQAVERLLIVLQPTSLKPGERDYLSTLAGFLFSAFESSIVPGASDIKPQKPSIKGLFHEDEASSASSTDSFHALEDPQVEEPSDATKKKKKHSDTESFSNDGFR